MGGVPWNYYVPFELSVESALHKLRQRVFESGDFRGSELNPSTPEEALDNTEADGTASILDIFQISKSPDFCSLSPLSDAELQNLFGTTKPSHEMIEANSGFYDDIERGQGIYIVVYAGDQPGEYFFAGYSFD